MNNDTLKLVARILISLIFILAGFSKFGNIGGTAGYIASVGLPASTALAWLAAIFEAVAGLMILVGFQTRLTSWALVAFCLFTGAVFHNNFGDQTQMIMFGIGSGRLLDAMRHGWFRYCITLAISRGSEAHQSVFEFQRARIPCRPCPSCPDRIDWPLWSGQMALLVDRKLITEAAKCLAGGISRA